MQGVLVVFYLYTTRGRSLEEFITLLSRDDHTSGWINSETGKQHYFKV